MRLDYSYLREVMLAIESAPYPVTARFTIEGLIDSSPKLQTHNIDETFFVITQLEQAGFVNADINPQIDGTTISQLTFPGNEFLQNIRDDKVWKKTLRELGKVGGSASITVLSGLAQAAMTNYLNLG